MNRKRIVPLLLLSIAATMERARSELSHDFICLANWKSLMHCTMFQAPQAIIDALRTVNFSAGVFDFRGRLVRTLYDNRSRIALRVRQLLSGRHYSQEPRSRLRHLVTNIEIVRRDGPETAVGCNVLVFESNLRGETLWGARTEYLLRATGDGLRMARKTVKLVNNDKPIYTLSFLI